MRVLETMRSWRGNVRFEKAPGGDPAGAGGLRVVLMIAELRAGGAERVAVHLVLGLKAAGHDPRVVCLQREGDLAAEVRSAGVPLVAMESMKGWDIRAVLRLRGLLRRWRPDAVNVHDRASLPYAAAASWPAGRRSLVYTGHGLLFGEAGRPRLRYRWAARGLAAMTAVSEEAGQRHASCLGWPGPVHVIPNGLPPWRRDPRLRAEMRRELGLPEEVFAFLAVGNARPEKGFEDLIEAASILRRRAPTRPFVVLVAGRMQDEDYCRRMLDAWRQAGLQEHLRFLGYRADVRALYSAADAFVLPSRSEGLPMVLLEAMMAGLPTAATRVGGVPKVLEGGAGLLVDAASPAQLAAAMRRLLEEPPLREALSQAAAARARTEYGLDRMCRGYVQVFEQVAGRRRP